MCAEFPRLTRAKQKITVAAQMSVWQQTVVTSPTELPLALISQSQSEK